MQQSAQPCEASMHSMEPCGCGQGWRNHRDITPVGWELSLLRLLQFIFSVPTVILEKHFAQIIFEKHKSTSGNQVCSTEGKFADKDMEIALASAAPVSDRALPSLALNCTTAAAAGAAPCHNHNLPAHFSSQVSSFSLLSPSLATSDHTPPSAFLG